jgi:hypothetical protein
MSVAVVVGTLTGALGRLSAARLAVVPAAPGSGADLSQAVCQRQANLRWPRRIVGVEVGDEGVPTRPCHGDRDLPQSRSPATSRPTYAEDPTDRVIRRRTLRVIPNSLHGASTVNRPMRVTTALPAWRNAVRGRADRRKGPPTMNHRAARADAAVPGMTSQPTIVLNDGRATRSSASGCT